LQNSKKGITSLENGGPEILEKAGFEASVGNMCQPEHPKALPGAVIQTKTHLVIS
jgi:hypothetical protein